MNKAINYLCPEDINVVIYHKNCNDGLASALCVYEKLGDSVEYIPMHYNDPIDFESLRNKNVLIVDFSFDKEVLCKIRSFAKKAMIIDHHASAEEKLKNVEGCFFDMSHSAAYLCYKYMNENSSSVPNFILYIEDRDIWKWDYREKSEPLSYGLKELNFSSKTFKSFKEYLKNDSLVEEAIKLGVAVVEKNKKYINEVTKRAKKVNYVVDSTNYKIMLLGLENPKLISETAEKLYTDNDVDFTVCWFPHRDNKFLNLKICKILYGEQRYILSFRTNKDNIDVSKIAKSLGGGGHVQAAGATINHHPNDLINHFVLSKLFFRLANNFFK